MDTIGTGSPFGYVVTEWNDYVISGFAPHLLSSPFLSIFLLKFPVDLLYSHPEVLAVLSVLLHRVTIAQAFHALSLG